MRPTRLGAALEHALGVPVAELSPIAGGDINLAYRARLAGGDAVFVKTHDAPPAGMYRAEARGLAFITCDGGPRVPEVLWAGDTSAAGQGAPAMLVLEFIEAGAVGPDHDERLGRGLAAIHRAHCDGFGLDDANFIGPLHQDNRPMPSWAEFYAQRRLAPLWRRAVDAGHIPTGARADFEQVLSRMDRLVGPPEPPARLHGDLWGGNAMVDGLGMPVLIDPAVYGGHREVDLAMMRLFGGFSQRCFDAYDELHPRAPGHTQRVGLYQLYPLLVHVNLFGAGYVSGLLRCLGGARSLL